jgi:phosphoglucomutase
MEWMTMDYFRRYQEWLCSPFVDEETKEMLRGISDQPAEIEERFYQHLPFGTGGVRAVLGVGTNRMNLYTIRRVTQGLAKYMKTVDPKAKERGIIIAYDSRYRSQEFALEAALTLRKNDIKVYLFASFCPTPLLSFAVRELQTMAGMVITASHNPPEYNGCKIYWEDGGQITPSLARDIMKKIEHVEEIVILPPTLSVGDPITWVGKELDDKYISRLKGICFDPDLQAAASLKVVYTPLHGVGNELVQRVLREFGFPQVTTVSEQEQPDPQFSTVTSPNPEEREALNMAITLGTTKKADLILATDPDGDRVGIVVRNQMGVYEFLTGNQIGVLLLYHLLSQHSQQGTLPIHPVVVKTLVTGQMGQVIADKYGVEMMETHTGFKYIGEQIRLLEESEIKTFLFGYEESCGYLAGTFVRDKDGVMATLLICQMAAYYKTRNKTLCDVLTQLYQEFGYFSEKLESRYFPGKKGLQTIQMIMDDWRTSLPQRIGSCTVIQVCDFKKQQSYHLHSGKYSQLQLPSANVLRFTLEDGSWFCLRPSGTEPKMKVYFSVQGKTSEDTAERLQQLIHDVMERIDTKNSMG